MNGELLPPKYRVFWRYPDGYEYTIAVTPTYLGVIVASMIAGIEIIDRVPTEEEVDGASASLKIGVQPESQAVLHVQRLRFPEAN